ncbi:MAG: aminoglycoside phosphotransferase family protein [Defluviitaleaceae bacterium]|nr:aminoglycoside phosphotransferase family protein [Defluviitaleaceae bacterium]
MLTENQINEIIKAWGQETYIKILKEIEIYTEKWKLSDLSFHESYSMNAIFYCKSEIYGECVLKIGGNFQHAEFVWEYNVLREYGGHRYIKVYESEIDLKAGKKVMLLERVFPGTQLQVEQSLDKRLEIFSGLFNGLHIKPENPALYKSYDTGLREGAEAISHRDDCKALYNHVLKAVDVYASIASVCDSGMLLHKDLQFHNILKKNDDTYAIVDPQGSIGASVIDVARYILIEYYNGPRTVEFMAYIIAYLEKSLNIPGDIIRKGFYIEAAAFEGWFATVGDYTLDTVIFAERMMQQQL